MTDAGTEAAIGSRNHVLAADERGKSNQPLADELRMFDDVGGMTDDAGHQRLAFRPAGAPPYFPFVFVPRVGGLQGVAPRVHLQHEIDDVAERDVVLVGTVPLPQHTCRRTISGGTPDSAWFSTSTRSAA